jgi:AcrR family transcriptional regulator
VSGPGSRTNGERSGAARERVLQAALPALASHGYSGSSLASIAAGAGLTTAGLLHHFPSKNELLVAVLAERDRLDGARLQLRGARGLTALDRLEELVAHNARNLELVRAFTVLLGESVGEDHPARRWAQERYPRRRANLVAALRAGVDSGEIRADVDADALAAQIIAMMDRLQVQWVLNPDGLDMSALVRKSSLTRHVAGSERRRLGDEGQGSTPPSGRLETTFSPERRSPAGEAQDYSATTSTSFAARYAPSRDAQPRRHPRRAVRFVARCRGPAAGHRRNGRLRPGRRPIRCAKHAHLPTSAETPGRSLQS